MVTMPDVADFLLKLEGPYKWYVIGGVLTVVTALVTRFIFKTLKWFIIILLAAIIVAAVVALVTDTGSAPGVGDRTAEIQAVP